MNMAWQIDPGHSTVSFSARHMMLTKVRGEFEKFSGTVDFNEANPSASSVDVTIDTSSINTRHDQRDGHLKSPDFLDAENYPTISFKSTRVEVINDTTGKIYGDLTIRGVTKEAVLDTEFNGIAKSPWGTESAGFSATTKINRKDWGLNWNVALETGGWLVGEEITIDIEIEVVKQAEQAAEEPVAA
jgi:polyisoprenoid-binding protein YceI